MRYTIAKLASFSLLLAVSAVLNAQTPMQILDKTAAKIEQSNGISGTFTLTAFEGTTVRDKVTGTMQIKGQMYLLKTPQITTWYNGQKMWTLMQGSDEVSLTIPTPEELQKSSPIAFLKVYKKGYKLSSKTATLRGKDTWEVTLKSKKKGTPHTIIVNIDKQTSLPMCIRINENGQWTRISANNLNTNRQLTPAQFSFPSKDYPNVQVIEL